MFPSREIDLIKIFNSTDNDFLILKVNEGIFIASKIISIV